MSTQHTPLMSQYFAIKDQYLDSLLLFQVGDFYELFFDDAKTAAHFLAIALTKHGKINGEDIPLCGIPVHVLNHYVVKLIKGGFKVAICDQLEKAQPGIVVKRGVTRVLTPGTLTDTSMLDEKSASYLLACAPLHDSCGLLFSELLTAQLFATTVSLETYRTIEAELVRFFPDEIVMSKQESTKKLESHFRSLGYFVSHGITSPSLQVDVNQWVDTTLHARARSDLEEQPAIKSSLSLLYSYLSKHQPVALKHFSSIQFYAPEDYLVLDPATQRNLELVKSAQDGSRSNTLLSVIDKAKTSMGSRTLKKWITRPLMQLDSIVQRHEVVAHLVQQPTRLQELEGLLEQLSDLERIVGRIALGRAQIGDYLALKDSLMIAPNIKQFLSDHIPCVLGNAIAEKIPDVSKLVSLLMCSINDDVQVSYKVKVGFDHQLDTLRHLVNNSQQEILKLEHHEREKTGISSIKIGYNNISGYYFEVTKPNLHLVPSYFVHSGTLVNRSRFTTEQLRVLEQDILRAQEEINEVERSVFNRIEQEIKEYVHLLRLLAHGLSYLDALTSFAIVAYNNRYVQPVFNTKQAVIITQGRHPVVEQRQRHQFIGNDTLLSDEQSLLVITGPNMGGKSTYLRQVALMVIMAQCGSFVPADQASLAVVDRIFTRIGSGDNVAEGKSTFLVEMEEVAMICHHATAKSLIILDEVGRGTSTSDGIALAQAIIEFMVEQIQARCLFATHYHELTTLADKYPMIKNYSMRCVRQHGKLHFLHSMQPGVAQRSFGLDVAQLAHLPAPIIVRATQIHDALISASHQGNYHSLSEFLPQEHEEKNTDMQKYSALCADMRLKSLDSLSARDALNLLWEWKEKNFF